METKSVTFVDKVEARDEKNQFLCSYVVFTDGKNYYKGTTSLLEPEDINEGNVSTLNSVLIPHDHIFPLYTDCLTTVPVPPDDTDRYFVKKPKLLGYNANEADKIPTRVLAEAQVLEVLSKKPHPNIVAYFGCLVEDNRVVGLCLERCVDTLYELTWLKRKTVDREKVIEGVRSGICHLHQLGYSHNDISLGNIMFREDGSIVIVDFDSCQRSGDKLGSKKGTPDFSDEEATMSDPKNDFYSLSKVDAYLRTGKLFTSD